MELHKSFDFPDVGGLLRKYHRLILLIMLICVSLFVAAAFLLPKKYKVKAVLNISSGYFQNTMVRDFVPEVNDGSELRAQRESLLNEALGPRFIEEIAEKYGLLSNNSLGDSKAERRRALELDELKKRLEIIGIGTTSFQIGFLYSKPEVAYNVTQDALIKAMEHLRSERRKSLIAIRDSIRRQMDSMVIEGSKAPDPTSNEKPDLLRQELRRVQEQIRALKSQYTDRHPRVVELSRRADLLSKWLKDAGADSAPSTEADWSATSHRETLRVSAQVYEDLVRKVNYLNVALDADAAGALSPVKIVLQPMMPLAPLWPNKKLMLGWGVMTGLLLSIVAIFFLELVMNAPSQLTQLAKTLNSHYMGELPYFRSGSRRRKTPKEDSESDSHQRSQHQSVSDESLDQ